MTAQPPASQFDSNGAAIFACARSDWLDDFSQLELAVRKCEERFNPARFPRGTPLSQRLPALAALKPSSSCSNDTLERLQKAVRACEAFLPLRASIVHSTLKTGKRGKSKVAIFQNSCDAVHGVPLYAVMTEEDFVRTGRVLRGLASEFTGLS